MSQAPYRIYFWILALISLGVIWYTPIIPNTDGMSHVYMGKLLRELLIGEDPFYAQHYQPIFTAPIPNLLSQYILAAIGFIAPPLQTEKIFLSGLAILYLVALRRFFGFFSQHHPATYFLPFLFLFTHPFMYGSFNYILSIAIALLLSEYYLRIAGNWTLPRVACIALAALLLYFSHLFGLVLWLLVIGLHSVFELCKAYRNNASIRPYFISACVILICMLLPIICFIEYANLPKLPMATYKPEGIAYAWRELLYGVSFISYRLDGVWIAMAIGWLSFLSWIAAIIFSKTVRPLAHIPMLLLSCFFMLLLLFGPDAMLGGWTLKWRYAQCFWICAFCYICMRLPTPQKNYAPFMAIIIAALILWRGWGMLAIQPMLQEVRSAAPFIKPHSIILTLNINENKTEFAELGTPRLATITPVLEYGSYWAAEKPLLWLDNYQTRERNIFPASIQPLYDPMEQLADELTRAIGEPSEYSKVNLRRYQERSGKAVDYVAVWGKEEYIENDARQAGYNHILQQLKRDYSLIYTSPHGLLRLWEFKRAD